MGATVNWNGLVFTGTSEYKITTVAIYGMEGEGDFKKKSQAFDICFFLKKTETLGISVAALYPYWGKQLQVFELYISTVLS